jgi:hypothetical protein
MPAKVQTFGIPETVKGNFERIEYSSLGRQGQEQKLWILENLFTLISW